MSAARGVVLSQLLHDVGLGGKVALEHDPVITGVSHDSRRIAEGDLYVAVVGASFDGRDFAGHAVAAGAVAVLGPSPEGPGALVDGQVPWIETSSPRELLGRLAQRIYGRPHEALRSVGVTGSNGKSTVVTLVTAMLEAAGLATAELGTLGYRLGDRVWPAPARTTPEATDLARVLRGMVDAGAQGCVMEVSSHALALGRVDGMSYEVAAFTNLSRDHLDFHGNMDGYFAAKRQLFAQLDEGGLAVVHVGSRMASAGDVAWGDRLVESLKAQDVPLVTCSGQPSGERRADVQLISEHLDLHGIRMILATPRGDISLRSPLIGGYHAENLITAVAIGEALELPHAAMVNGVADVAVIPGRLERVAGGTTPAFVDFAHTPGALAAALGALRALDSRRKLIAVFGCGGERDRGKRPQMGEIAGRLADLPILTSDNPRREDPLAIIADAEAGLRQSSCVSYVVEPDRRLAIQAAARRAAHGGEWTIVVAGKGHETTQDLGSEIVPFDDRHELAAALAAAGESANAASLDAGSMNAASMSEVSHG